MERQAIAGASRPYERLRRRLIRARLRLASWVALFFVAAAAVLDLAFAPDQVPARLLGLAAIGAIHLLTLALLRVPAVCRHTRSLALGMNLAVYLGFLHLLSFSPTDSDVFVGPIVAVLMGSTLLYPWGPAPQAALSLSVMLGYLAVAWPHLNNGSMRAANTVLSVMTCALMAVIGAWILERSRRQAFAERQRVRALAVQRRRLLDVGRELRSTLERDIVLARLVEHARRLVHADGLSLLLRDGAVYRLSNTAGDGALQPFTGLPLRDVFAAAFTAEHGPSELREYPGTSFDPVIVPALATLGYQRMLTAVIGQQPQAMGYINWCRRDDVPFSAAERMAALGIADQAQTALAAAALYEEAANAGRLKTEFVSTMSHELRTPLNVITGYTQILSETLAPEPETQRALDAVQRASHELLDLINATLDLGRLESGAARDVDEQRLVMQELFEELAGEFAAVPRASGVTLSWDAAAGPPVLIDRRKIRTVLKNLVGNALKFTPAGGVRVECRFPGDRCRLRVIDTGIGIHPDDHAVIFDMFRQADSSDRRRFGGTGLGLYIVRRLLQILGGTVTLESRPGCGSTFTVTVPLDGVGSSRAAAA